jgi:cytochrome P450
MMLKQFKQLRSFTQDPLIFITNQRKEQGDFFTMNLGIKKIHFACHPKYAEAMLGMKTDQFQKSRLIFNKIRPITGKRGLVQLENDDWTRMRKITNEIFQRQYMARYPEMMIYYLDKECEKIDGAAAVNIMALMTSYTLKTALSVIFGNVNNETVESFSSLFLELNARCGLRMRSLLSLPSIRIYRIQQALRAKIMALVTSQHTEGVSLMSVLRQQIPRRDNDARELIVDQLMTFLFAGFETTAASLASSLYLIAKYPELQEKIIGDDDKKSYTTAVYKEALRLYPPAWMLARQAVTDTLLCEQNIAKGDNIFLSVREIHRHPDYWSLPDSCKPERFFLDDKPRFSFLPFGMGKRICSGHAMAMMEAVLAISRLCQRYQFSLPDNQPLKMQAMVTLHPVGNINLRVIKR